LFLHKLIHQCTFILTTPGSHLKYITDSAGKKINTVGEKMETTEKEKKNRTYEGAQHSLPFIHRRMNKQHVTIIQRTINVVKHELFS
jgi:hypothetical protein